MTLEELSQQVSTLNRPEQKDEPMVYQVWYDGEITLQKGGSLLWQRNLHMLTLGIKDLRMSLPNEVSTGQFIWATKDGVKAAMILIAKYLEVKEGNPCQR